MQFEALIQDFMNYQEFEERNSAGELAQKQLCFANHLRPHFGAMALCDITARDLRAYASAKRQAGYAASTVNNHLIILAKFLRFALDEKHIAAIPTCRREKQPKPIETNFLTPKESRRLLKAAAEHRNKQWRLAMYVALNTGLRIGELMALSWDNVDLIRARLVVTHSYCRVSRVNKPPKSGVSRVVYLNQTAVSALAAMRKLLPQEERRTQVFSIDYSAALRAMRRTVARAKLDKAVTWHTLRHTFASNLAQQGIPLFTVSKLLGHASIAMTERYSHLYEDSARDAVNVLLTVGKGRPKKRRAVA